MKRFIILLCVVAFIVALPLSHVAAKGKAPKIEICHGTDSLDLGTLEVVYGHVISVSGNALAAHEGHGDSVEFFAYNKGANANYPGTDCGFIHWFE